MTCAALAMNLQFIHLKNGMIQNTAMAKVRAVV